MKTAVIGSGIGGLAIAIRLAKKGHIVTVFEKNSRPGGKLSEIKEAGYRFDTGPSLFTLPELVSELFKDLPADAPKAPAYLPLDNSCRYFNEDGSYLNFFQDKTQLKNEIETKTHEPYSSISKRLKEAEEIYKLSAPMFLFNSLHKKETYLNKAHQKLPLNLHKMKFFSSMHKANEKDFTDKRIIQLFDRYATYNGSNPYKAPATLNMIAHLENNIGAALPEKGMYSIVETLFSLAKYLKIEFRFDSLVEKIIINKKVATGLQSNGSTYYFDSIISDCDVKYVARNLLKHPLKKRIEKQESSTSALIFYWGIKKSFSQLDLHNIFFSSDYKEEFKHLFKHKTLSADPTIYIYISSKKVKGDAPSGNENWFVMVNAPSNKHLDWDTLIESTKRNIITRLNKILNTDIENLIEFEKIASPLSIEKNTLSPEGALYGPSSNSMLAAFLRHPNFLRSIKNLYFVGGSVHPGGGIPLCLASAKIVANEFPNN